MSPDPAKPGLSPLRLWPALVLVAILWVLRALPAMANTLTPPVLMAAFFGPVASALLILVWWLAGSRASRREKLIGAGGGVALLVVTTLLSHPSVQLFGTLRSAVPWGATAFVLGLVVARRAQPGRRSAVALLAVAVAFGFWTLVRTDGSGATSTPSTSGAGSRRPRTASSPRGRSGPAAKTSPSLSPRPIGLASAALGATAWCPA